MNIVRRLHPNFLKLALLIGLAVTAQAVAGQSPSINGANTPMTKTVGKARIP